MRETLRTGRRLGSAIRVRNPGKISPRGQTAWSLPEVRVRSGNQLMSPVHFIDRRLVDWLDHHLVNIDVRRP